MTVVQLILVKDVTQPIEVRELNPVKVDLDAISGVLSLVVNGHLQLVGLADVFGILRQEVVRE